MARYRVPKDLEREYRRLVQLANRRIRSAQEHYEKAGKTIAPKELVGHVQSRYDWHTEKTPLSRKVVFDSKREFDNYMRYLRRFDPKLHATPRPTVTQYTKLQRAITAQSLISSFGGIDVPTSLLEQINKMSAPELAEFWKRFSEKSRRIAPNYSSLQAMQETLNEIFPEDVQQFTGIASDIRSQAG